ncbi:Disease resistance protein RGA2 [Vitis vinifera]|uniref:Disease resistance protein RGA2 n=1 Tax=Vitis vinifera TaxID=29760 RepID=A0A438CAG4_VITVI|nr:Disease resistance protein RGA2 [Vitis vinifera]
MGMLLSILETLSFEDMKNWEKWLCCGEFPRLQKLFYTKVSKLTGKLPEQLLSLVELQIDGCPQLLMASLTVPAIRQLRMVDFGKLRLQMPGCDFTALQTSEIEILDVSQWSQLPMAPHQLSIRKCDYVESLLEEEISQTNIHDLKICDFLERLIIERGVIDDSLSLSFSLGIFPKLTDFEINGLNGLEKLSILVSEGDPTSLCSLRLRGGCEDIELFHKECLLPSSLTSLQIWNLPNLKSLDSGGLQQLTSLLELRIYFCPKLQFSTGSVLQHLISLKRLVICQCSRLQSLTEAGLQHLTSLESLWIHECPMLQSLKKVGLQHLTSLKTLEIMICRKLKYLTKERLSDSLSFLRIYGCPLLEKRCQFEKGEEWRYIAHIPKIMINVFIVSNQDEHRRFVMINKVSIMTMEETCKMFEPPLVQQLAVIGRPCKMCSNQVDFCKEEGRFLGAQHLMLIALFKKTKKLRGSVSEIAAWPMGRLTIPSTVKQFFDENLLLGPNGLWKLCNFGSTSTNHKHFKKPEEMGIEEDNIRKYSTPAHTAPEVEWKTMFLHREKIEATDWELQQRKSVSPGPDSDLWQAFSEAGAQTTIASLLGPEMAITTNQPQKELLALKLGVLEQRVLQPPLLPALIFPDPPLEAIMPSCLLTQRRLRASWLLNLLNGLVSNLFGDVISSWALLAIRDGNRIQHLHMFPGFHGLLTNLYCSECLDFQLDNRMVVTYLTDVVLLDHGMKENSTLSSVIQNHLKPGPWNKLKPFCTEQLDSLKFLICKYPKWRNWRKGRFLGAELLMFIALFKKNKKLPSDACECSSLVAYQKLSQSKFATLAVHKSSGASRKEA